MSTKQYKSDDADTVRPRPLDDEEYRRWDIDLAAEKEAWRLALERAHSSSSRLLQRAAELAGSTRH